MAWKEIPNEIVRGWDGKPRKHQRVTDDGEYVFEEFACNYDDCEEKFTTAGVDYRNHAKDAHEGKMARVNLAKVMDDTKVSDLIYGLLLGIGDQDPASIFRPIRRPNDGGRATETWRRTRIAVDSGKPIRLRPEEYEWLHLLLDRKLPFPKEQKDAGGEQQTIGTLLYGLDLFNVQQALTIVSERRVPEKDEDGPAPVSNNGVADKVAVG